MDSLKKYFKQDLACFKGKVLDDKLISLLSQKLESSFMDFMGNEGFYLENAQTGLVVKAHGIEKNYTVQSATEWNLTKEYDTMSGAIRATEKNF